MRPLTSGLAERQSDEPRRVADLHAHENIVLALRLRLAERLTHIAGIGDSLAANIEDDVALLQAMLGGRAVRIDRGDHDTPSAGTGLFRGEHHRQAEMRHAAGWLRLFGVGL